MKLGIKTRLKERLEKLLRDSSIIYEEIPLLEDIKEFAAKPEDDLDSQKALNFWEKLHQEEINHKRLLNKNLEQDIKFRKRFAERIFYLICGWLLFVVVVIILEGLKNSNFIWWNGYKFAFSLDSKVIMVLLGTTTVTVVGLFAAVTGHFFNRNNR